jgi:hypothetical protein
VARRHSNLRHDDVGASRSRCFRATSGCILGSTRPGTKQTDSEPHLIRDVVEAAVSEATFLQAARKLQKTLGIPLVGDPVKTVEVLANRYVLNDGERAGVLRHLIADGDLTAYGLVNAVTHYSHEVDDYDRATEFEALGGRLIELAQSEWRSLAEAA